MKRWVSIYVILLYTAICISLLFAASCGSRARSPEENDALQGQLQKETEEVRDFVNEAVSENMMEIRMAEIAMERSQHPEVDELAKSIKQDHLEASEDLRSIASEKSWSVPVMLLDKHAEKIQKLLKGKRENINEEYLELTANTHEDAIRLWEKYANKSHDTEVVMWANQTLPVLRRHLQNSKELLNRVEESQAAAAVEAVDETAP